MVKDLVFYQEANRVILPKWVAKSHNNVMKNISSKDNFTYHEAKVRIRHLAANHCSPSRFSSKNSKHQLEVLPIASSNSQIEKMKLTSSPSSCNSGSKE
jgi:hypothetical protein